MSKNFKMKCIGIWISCDLEFNCFLKFGFCILQQVYSIYPALFEHLSGPYT